MHLRNLTQKDIKNQVEIRNRKQKHSSKKDNFNSYHRNLVYRDILCGLAVVLQDDSDVHVDDDEEADDEICEEEGDCHDGVATVALVASLRVS